MAPKMWTYLVFCLFIDTWTVWGQRQQTASPPVCLQSLDSQCGHHYTWLEQLNTRASGGRGSNVQLCRAVDVVIGCSADVISNCDVMEGPYLAETVIKPEIIETYRLECTTLRNASLAVYADDKCRQGLSECASFLLRAELPSPTTQTDNTPTTPSVNPVFACLFFDYFNECVSRQLTACSSAVLTAVDRKVQYEQGRSNRLYRCSQRKGEVRLEQCLGTLLYNRDPLDRDDLCQLYEETQVCGKAAKSQGSVDLSPAAFDQRLASVSAFALQDPFFCHSDNPCMETVKACNATVTSSSPPEHPCQLREVYQDCLARSLHKCERSDQVATVGEMQQAVDSLNQQYACEDSDPPPSSGQEAGESTACDEVALSCSQPLRDAVQQGDDKARICQSVDSLVTCAIKGSGQCDAVSLADLKNAVNSVITNTSCALDRAHDPALQMTPCDKAMVKCGDGLLEADSFLPFDLLAACRAYQGYQQCTQNELTACDADTLTQINARVQREQARFNGEPYFCAYRDQLTSLSPDQYFGLCQSDFFTVMRFQTPLQDICIAVERFSQCVAEAQASASTTQQSEFESILSQMSEPYTQSPYFCTAENPCLKRFQDCRVISADLIKEPCDEQGLLDSCWQGTSPTCVSEEQLDEFTALAVREKGLIEQIHQCSLRKSETATTTKAATEVPTPVTGTSPVTESAGVDNRFPNPTLPPPETTMTTTTTKPAPTTKTAAPVVPRKEPKPLVPSVGQKPQSDGQSPSVVAKQGESVGSAATASADSGASWNQPWLTILILCVLTAAIYHP